MEKGIENSSVEGGNVQLLQYLKEQFQIKEVDIKTYSPLTLAYIGDCIYDLVIRTLVVTGGNCAANVLHTRTSRLVKADTQAAIIEILMEELTEEEKAVYKRGRNAKSGNTAKNASVGAYRRATGLEAVMGYLYLKEDYKRIADLVKSGLEKLNLKAGE